MSIEKILSSVDQLLHCSYMWSRTSFKHRSRLESNQHEYCSRDETKNKRNKATTPRCGTIVTNLVIIETDNQCHQSANDIM